MSDPRAIKLTPSTTTKTITVTGDFNGDGFEDSVPITLVLKNGFKYQKGGLYGPSSHVSEFILSARVNYKNLLWGTKEGEKAKNSNPTFFMPVLNGGTQTIQQFKKGTLVTCKDRLTNTKSTDTATETCSCQCEKKPVTGIVESYKINPHTYFDGPFHHEGNDFGVNINSIDRHATIVGVSLVVKQGKKVHPFEIDNCAINQPK